MCSVGDLPEIDMEQAHRTLKLKNYECLDCGRKCQMHLLSLK